jgi:hypothetical protein
MTKCLCNRTRLTTFISTTHHRLVEQHGWWMLPSVFTFAQSDPIAGAALQTTLHVFFRLVVRSSTIALTSQKSESTAYIVPRFLTRSKNVILLQLDRESVRNLVAQCCVRGSALGVL